MDAATAFIHLKSCPNPSPLLRPLPILTPTPPKMGLGGYYESTQLSALLLFLFFGHEDVTFNVSESPDHSILEVYISGTLWQSFDGYGASAGQRDIVITLGVDSRKLQGEGPHLVEIRNRAEKNKTSTGYKLRFKQLLVVDRTWTLQTVKYSYDKLSRLLEARYAPGANAAALDATCSPMTEPATGCRSRWHSMAARRR